MIAVMIKERRVRNPMKTNHVDKAKIIVNKKAMGTEGAKSAKTPPWIP